MKKNKSKRPSPKLLAREWSRVHVKKKAILIDCREDLAEWWDFYCYGRPTKMAPFGPSRDSLTFNKLCEDLGL